MPKRRYKGRVIIAWLAMVTAALITLTALIQLIGAVVGLAHH